MNYANKQIKRIIRVQELIEISDTLVKVYNDFDDKKFIIDTFTDKEVIYKLYCSSVYNLIIAIQGSKEFFEKSKKYVKFKNLLNQKYTSVDNKYCNKNNYESTLFKIIETIRHQVNHFAKDDDDNNILFETYIDFNIIEDLRTIIKDIFYETYSEIDKDKIKSITLAKPKIQYSFDKINNKIDELELRISESDNRLNEVFKKDNDRAIELFDQLFNDSNLYDLLMKDPEAIKKLDSADKEIKESFEKIEEHISKNGTELEKEAMLVFKRFMDEKDNESIKDVNKNVQEFFEKLSILKGKKDN